MMNWKKRLRLDKLILLAFLLSSCDQHVSKEGIKYLKEFRRENRCYDFTTGGSTAHAIEGLKKGFYSIGVHLRGCHYPYQYNNEELYKSDSLVKPIAEKILLELKKKELYDGIMISVGTSKFSSYYIEYYYEINDDQLILKLKRRGNK